ncbi:MAG: hypothetical protein JWN39_526 [Ilumatobacteraceae bacterium]|nr:hypothetical protein [Ilumatobacteraceae bacterium]
MSTALEAHPSHLAQRRAGSVTREVVSFLAISFAIAVAIAVALPGTKADPGPAPLLTLLTPALAVGVVRRLGRRQRAAELPLGLRRLGLTGWLAAIVLPVLAVGGSFVVADLLGVVGIRDLSGFVADAPINLAVFTVLVLGEEIGWRGFLLQRLRSVLPVRSAAMATGVVQGLFHLPLILLTSSYDSAGNRVFVAVGAASVISLAGALFGWLRIRTGSLWPVAIAHAAANVCIIETPYLVTADPDRAAYLTGEAGVFTLVLVAVCAAALLTRANWAPRLPPSTKASSLDQA